MYELRNSISLQHLFESRVQSDETHSRGETAVHEPTFASSSGLDRLTTLDQKFRDETTKKTRGKGECVMVV